MGRHRQLRIVLVGLAGLVGLVLLTAAAIVWPLLAAALGVVLAAAIVRDIRHGAWRRLSVFAALLIAAGACSWASEATARTGAFWRSTAACSRVDAERLDQPVEFAFDDVERLSTSRDVRGDPRTNDRLQQRVDLASALPRVPLVPAQRTPRERWVEIVVRHGRSVPSGADAPG